MSSDKLLAGVELARVENALFAGVENAEEVDAEGNETGHSDLVEVPGVPPDGLITMLEEVDATEGDGIGRGHCAKHSGMSYSSVADAF